MEVDDGYVLSGRTDPEDEISFHKYDFQGNQLWGGMKKSNYIGRPSAMHKKSNGNFSMVFQHAIVEFDKDLNIVQQSAIQETLGLIQNKLCYLTDGICVLAGIRPGLSDLFFAKLNSSYQTNCDTTPIPMTLELDTANIIPTPVVRSTYLLSAISQGYSVDTFSVVTDLDIPPL